ncbi:MAG: chemotaxis protein MotB [Robiginitomaculum sp.]|nr:MAG: chemotaxis protein MotB [Robiginitomaculum sp.]
MNEPVQPIIIRRKKIYQVAGGHHGGAWKVAYADFVTAMMAFFLMMWLLGATTEDQRKGISDYFNPNIPLAAVSGGGSDALGGDSIFAEDTNAQNGVGATSIKPHNKGTAETQNSENEEAGEKERLEALNESLAEESQDISEHMQIKMTPEGLVIELVDSETEPLFTVGGTVPSPLLKNLINMVAAAFQGVPNNIKIVGHTDSRSYNGGAEYSNWELSSDRANMARRLLIASKFPHAQIVEVSGKADTDHVVDDGLAAQNRRISIIILK